MNPDGTAVVTASFGTKDTGKLAIHSFTQHPLHEPSVRTTEGHETGLVLAHRSRKIRQKICTHKV